MPRGKRGGRKKGGKKKGAAASASASTAAPPANPLAPGSGPPPLVIQLADPDPLQRGFACGALAQELAREELIEPLLAHDVDAVLVQLLSDEHAAVPGDAAAALRNLVVTGGIDMSVRLIETHNILEPLMRMLQRAHTAADELGQSVAESVAAAAATNSSGNKIGSGGSVDTGAHEAGVYLGGMLEHGMVLLSELAQFDARAVTAASHAGCDTLALLYLLGLGPVATAPLGPGVVTAAASLVPVLSEDGSGSAMARALGERPEFAIALTERLRTAHESPTAALARSAALVTALNLNVVDTADAEAEAVFWTALQDMTGEDLDSVLVAEAANAHMNGVADALSTRLVAQRHACEALANACVLDHEAAEAACRRAGGDPTAGEEALMAQAQHIGELVAARGLFVSLATRTKPLTAATERQYLGIGHPGQRVLQAHAQLQTAALGCLANVLEVIDLAAVEGGGDQALSALWVRFTAMAADPPMALAQRQGGSEFAQAVTTAAFSLLRALATSTSEGVGEHFEIPETTAETMCNLAVLHADPGVRCSALGIVGILAQVPALEAQRSQFGSLLLHSAGNDSEAAVRCDAMHALFDAFGEPAVDPIVAQLDMGPQLQEALTALRQAMRENKRDWPPPLRQRVTETLSLLGDYIDLVRAAVP